jgi:hypothetical protein
MPAKKPAARKPSKSKPPTPRQKTDVNEVMHTLGMGKAAKKGGAVRGARPGATGLRRYRLPGR